MIDKHKQERAQEPHLQRDVEGALYSLVSSTASVVGADYFIAIAQALAQTLGVYSGFACEYPRDTTVVRTLGVWPHEAVTDQIEFDVSGAAAERTHTGALAFYPSDTQSLFPADGLVQALGLKSLLAVPVHGSSGKPNGFLGIGDRKRMSAALPSEAMLRLVAARAGAEIERIQTERRLTEQGELLRLFTERAEDTVMRFHFVPGPQCEYVSPSFERLTGYTAEELYADTRLLLRIVHPDDREEMSKLIAGNDSKQNRWRLITKSGGLIWVEGRRVAVRNDDGEIVAMEDVVRDITAERIAQLNLEEIARRHQFLLEAIPDTILHVSNRGYVVDIAASAETEPFNDRQDVVGRHMSELFPPDVAGLAEQRLSTALQTDTTQAFRYRLPRGDIDRLLEVRMVPAGADQVVVLLRDITADDWFFEEEARRKAREQGENRAEEYVRAKNPYGLTFREFTVLELVAAGGGDKQIAAELAISVHTVGKHVSNILRKMNASSRTEATVRAMHEDLLGN